MASNTLGVILAAVVPAVVGIIVAIIFNIVAASGATDKPMIILGLVINAIALVIAVDSLIIAGIALDSIKYINAQ